MKKFYMISLGILLINIILSLVTGSFIPVVVGVVIASMFIIGIIAYLNDFDKKFISLINRIAKDPDKLTIAKILMGVVLMIVLIIIILTIQSCNDDNKDNKNETTPIITTTVVKETTTEKETTTVEETTTEKETTTVEETTTVVYETVNKGSSNYPVRETTGSNYEELESSKKEELLLPVETTVRNGSVSPTLGEEETTKILPVEVPTVPIQETTTEEKNFVILPSNPYEDETTSKEEKVTIESTTSKEDVETTTVEETTTTTETTLAKANITISYTSGANVANVLVTFDKPTEAKFIVSWYTVATNDYTIVKNSDNSYSLKVVVPDDFKSKLIVRVFDENGNELKQIQKIINNK